MRALAAHLGLSHSTVSRALRGDKRITAAVQKRVLKAAQKLGYKRDAKMAELMTHLRLARHRSFQGTLAWISNLDPADPDMCGMIEGFRPHAAEQAERLGYKLDVFFRATPADAPRLARTLNARGINGVWASMFWQVDYDEWKWDWQKFAFIHHGAEPRRRIVNVVDSEDRQNIQLLFENLAGRGYRRIGVATTLALEREALFELCAGRVRFAHRDSHHPAFEPCLVNDLEPSSATRIARWIEEHRVDCVVSRWRGMEDLLVRIGYRIPQDIGLAYVTVRPHSPSTGIDVNAGLIARTAIESLVSAVEQRRFGLPEFPQQTLVPGLWHQGTTTR